MRITAGVKPHSDPAISRKDAHDMAEALSLRLGEQKSRRHSLKHFSDFDSAVPDGTDPTAASTQAVVLLGDCTRQQWRGIRPQLASLLLLVAQMAKRDGYSLRVVAETALHRL